MCKADPNALTVPPKGETVVHPLGRDWPREDPFGWLSAPPAAERWITVEEAAELYPPREAALDRLSAPPRATKGETAALVAGSIWARLCGRSRWLSCAILIAAGVMFVIAGALKGFGNLIH
jgi:hypothetical protein